MVSICEISNLTDVAAVFFWCSCHLRMLVSVINGPFQNGDPITFDISNRRNSFAALSQPTNGQPYLSCQQRRSPPFTFVQKTTLHLCIYVQKILGPLICMRSAASRRRFIKRSVIGSYFWIPGVRRLSAAVAKRPSVVRKEFYLKNKVGPFESHLICDVDWTPWRHLVFLSDHCIFIACKHFRADR